MNFWTSLISTLKDFLIKKEPEKPDVDPYPPWVEVAESFIGIKEISGKQHNPQIVAFHKMTTLRASDDETPWCSSFVNYCINASGLEGTGKANARSWLSWGDKLINPAYGCVVVLSRGSSPTSGHVGFYIGPDPKNKANFMMLGGNQGDSVSIAQFKKSAVLGYRWPKQNT